MQIFARRIALSRSLERLCSGRDGRAASRRAVALVATAWDREAAGPGELSAVAARRAVSVRASSVPASCDAQRPGECALRASRGHQRQPSVPPTACAQTASFDARPVLPLRPARACARDAPGARRPLARFSSSPSLRLLIVPKTPLLCNRAPRCAGAARLLAQKPINESRQARYSRARPNRGVGTRPRAAWPRTSAPVRETRNAVRARRTAEPVTQSRPRERNGTRRPGPAGSRLRRNADGPSHRKRYLTEGTPGFYETSPW